jgi:hypothetical protein
MDDESLVAVAEDLEYLSQWGPDITDPEIRWGSAVLRRLLVEDAYGQAWRAMGRSKQPNLIAVDLEAVIGTQAADVHLAMAGGAFLRGAKVACVTTSHRQLLTAPSPPLRQDGYPGERLYSLSEFVGSLSGVADGRDFSRREVIKYIANIKGGVHLSQLQRESERKLVAKMEKIDKKLTLLNSDSLLVELVAIGQAVGGSDDAKALSADIRVRCVPS